MSELYVPEAELFANHEQVVATFPEYPGTFATADRFIDSNTGITTELKFVSVLDPANRRQGWASHLVSRVVYDAIDFGSESFVMKQAAHPASLYIARTIFGAENLFENPGAETPLDFDAALALTSEKLGSGTGTDVYVNLMSAAVKAKLGL